MEDFDQAQSSQTASTVSKVVFDIALQSGDKELLQVGEVTDNYTGIGGVIHVVTNLLKSRDRLKYDNTVVILKQHVTPLVGSLQGCVSRTLLSALTQMINEFPAELVEGLFLPVMLISPFGAAQAGLIKKLINSMTSTHVNLLWRTFIQESNTRKCEWNEHLVTVLQVMVENEELENVGLDFKALIETLQRNAINLARSPTFANVVATLCNRFNKLSDFSIELLEIASSNQSIFKGKLLKAVKKLRYPSVPAS